MARTAQTARKSTSGGAPRKQLSGGDTTVRVPFTDHAGNAALFVYWRTLDVDDEGPFLPPLFSFQVYVTNGWTADNNDGLPAKILEDCQQAYSYRLENVGQWRFDVHFLPGASHDEVIEHYRNEKYHREGQALHVLPTALHHVMLPYDNMLYVFSSTAWREEGVELCDFDVYNEVLEQGWIVDWGIHQDPCWRRSPVVNQNGDSGFAAHCIDVWTYSSLGEVYRWRTDEEREKGVRRWEHSELDNSAEAIQYAWDEMWRNMPDEEEEGDAAWRQSDEQLQGEWFSA